MADFLAPADLAKAFNGISEKKAALPAAKMIILGILAGVYIAFAAHLATTIATGSAIVVDTIAPSINVDALTTKNNTPLP